MLSRCSHRILLRTRATIYHHRSDRHWARSSSPFEYIEDGKPPSNSTNLQPTLKALSTYDVQARAFTTSTHLLNPPATSEQVSSQHTEQTPPEFSSDLLGCSKNVRDYLRQWSIQNHQISAGDAPTNIPVYPHQAGLPNSVFLKDDQKLTAEDAKGDELAEDTLSANAVAGADAGAETHAATSLREIFPGDLFLINVPQARQQYAIYLGHCEYQAQYLLADGRWCAHTRTQWDGYIIPKFATELEIDAVRPFLPSQPVGNTPNTSDNYRLPSAIFGDVPLSAASSLLAKMKSLAYEVEEHRRRYVHVLANLHEKLAHESQFKFLSLEEIMEQHFDTDYQSAADSLKMMIVDHFTESYTLLPLLSRKSYRISVMPKRLHRAVAATIEWARQYQDAAARAAMGKDVSQELQKNPLTSFISKARRLVTKSRKIRLPILGRALGSTLPDAKPTDSTLHRVATGEQFDASDRAVIEFLWLTYVKLPKANTSTMAQHLSIGSLVLRAVGAYPATTLELSTGRIFLTELGCLDPWFDVSDHSVIAPVAFLGLNHNLCIAKERADESLSQIEEDWNGTDVPFSDTMSDMRRDWGDMAVFVVDSPGTILVDDGFSVELSNEHPNCYWIHVHLAHLSAFLPFVHPFTELFKARGAGYYSPLGNESALSLKVLRSFSVGPGKAVLTCSTLLAQDGSVRKVEFTPGIVRNIVKLHPHELNRFTKSGMLATHQLSVGKRMINPKPELAASNPQDELLISEEYGAEIQVLQRLLIARWKARYRENPNYLKMPRLPRFYRTKVSVFPSKAMDRSHDRIFRSEHCVGDPAVSVTSFLQSLDDTPEGVPEQEDVLGCTMLLAQESAGLWLRQRNVPAIYRHSSTRANFDMEKLNKLGPHEVYITPSSGEGIIPAPHLPLNLAQMSPVTNSLRRYVDLLNHYNIDAYLKAQATTSGQDMANVEYPSSFAKLAKFVNENDISKDLASVTGQSRNHWALSALFRAYHFGEAVLPKVWDFQIGNPLRIGRGLDADIAFVGNLMALNMMVNVRPSAEGWEKGAKFRQFLPVKLVEVWMTNEIFCEAVGPPSDSPIVNNGSLQHMELTAQDNSMDLDTGSTDT